MIDTILKRHIQIIRYSHTFGNSIKSMLEALQGEMVLLLVEDEEQGRYLTPMERVERFTNESNQNLLTFSKTALNRLSQAVKDIQDLEGRFLEKSFVGPYSASEGVSHFVLGVSIEEWLDSILMSLRREMLGSYRISVLNENDLVLLLNKFRGTRKNGYKDSIFYAHFQRIHSLARSVVLQTANDTRLDFYKKSPTLFESISSAYPFGWNPSRKGGSSLHAYRLSDMSPLNGSPEWENSISHFNSTVTQVPLLSGEKTPLNYLNQWFERQDESFQRDTLGEKRYQLWKNGKLTYSQAFDLSSRSILLTELL